MDNLGFEESGPNSRKLGRSVSMNTESFPLHHKTTNSSLLLRWSRSRGDPEDMLEEEYPSDDFEYMECGPSPPADHAPNIYESFEEFSTPHELTVQICHDTIKMSLLEHMKSCSGRHHFLDDIESKKITQENVLTSFQGATKAEINISFLWSAFMKRWDLLDGLLSIGAQIQYHEPSQGMSALHLAAFSGCLAGTQFLISKGANVNVSYKCYTPLHCSAFGDSPETAMVLLNNGAKVHSLTTNSSVHESVLHCAVRANAVACVRLFTAEGADVCQVEYAGMSPIHLAADLGQTQCLKVMMEAEGGVDINAKTKERDMTALHLAAEGGFIDILEVRLR